jgi:hypothetical protein
MWKKNRKSSLIDALSIYINTNTSSKFELFLKVFLKLISMFIFKVYFTQKPALLYAEIYKNALLPSNARTRNQIAHTNLVRVPFFKHKFGLNTFECFSANFINAFFNTIPSYIKDFKLYIADNL